MSNDIRFLSMAFRTDSYHNLVLAKSVKDHYLYCREPMRAKILVLNHMSVECSLKCIIAIERPDKDLGHIYKIIKKCGHDLSKLASASSSGVIDQPLRDRLKSFNPQGVNLRYGFEVMMLNADTLFDPGRSSQFTDSKLNEAFEMAELMKGV